MFVSLRYRWLLLAQVIAVCLVPSASFAQQPRSPRMPAPPPMRFVSRDERTLLTATRDMKARLRTSLELAEAHLTRAEGSTTGKNFDFASEEVGRYLGLIEDVRQVLRELNRDKNSTRDLYRRFEIAMRAHLPRLAVMRRTTPADYAGHIKTAEEFARDARSEALDSFYGHSVLREGAENEKKPDQTKEPPEGKRP